MTDKNLDLPHKLEPRGRKLESFLHHQSEHSESKVRKARASISTKKDLKKKERKKKIGS